MRYRARFWGECVLGTLTGVLGLVTIFWRDWIEMLTEWDPDQHSGSMEWLIVGVLLLASVCAFLLARVEWRRTAALGGSAA